jgi:hypothetical protein
VKNGEHVRVVVHEPVSTSEDADQAEIVSLVRERIQSGLPPSE